MEKYIPNDSSLDFKNLLLAESKKHKLKSSVLQGSDDSSILLLQPSKPVSGKNILIIAGTHGNERNGPPSVLHFIQNFYDDYSKKINISFMPLINEYGYSNNVREDQNKQDINRFISIDNKRFFSKSPRGRIILNNKELLVNLAKDGYLSIHSDPDITKSYLYIRSTKKDDLDKELIRFMGTMFPIFNDGELYGDVVRQGIIRDSNLPAGVDEVFFYSGVPSVVTLETPAVDLQVKKACAAIRKYITLIVHQK